jgi:Protein of unknown function (DUF2917)
LSSRCGRFTFARPLSSRCGRFTFALGAGELARLERAAGLEVACESGRVWITEERDAADLWLDAGQSVRLRGSGLALIEATDAARVRIEGSLARG